MENEIVNRVANSGLVQIDLDEWAFDSEVAEYDMAQNLHEGLILREKDFREFISKNDWSVYKGKSVAVHCTTDAIIPNWAFMLLATSIAKAGGQCHYGKVEEVREHMLLERIAETDFAQYGGKKVLLKGCGKMEVSPEIYMLLSRELLKVVDSLMFGEACSSVPVYKKARQK